VTSSKKARRKSETQLVVELHAETAALCQSEIACAVADAWQTHRHFMMGRTALYDALNRLEEATRSSSLRKAKP